VAAVQGDQVIYPGLHGRNDNRHIGGMGNHVQVRLHRF
jgi:hypothetical protein